MGQKETIQKLTRGITEVLSVEDLQKKIEKSDRDGKPLKIKAGFDPTAPDIHLGHVVLLRKLRQFQDLGHVVYFLIGDFTAQIGDPTGRDQLRPKLTNREIKENAKTYKKQVFKVLDPKKTKIVFNSQWLNKLKPQDMLELSAQSTVAQMLARNDFKTRYDQHKEISILEFLYPLLQGYDSVYLKADVELGGTDQRFNLLMGRQLQGTYKQAPQVVMMTPLIEGTDGVQKMSKSLNNYIGINDEPKEMFGKIMSIGDELMFKYYECLTDDDLELVKALHPRDAKIRLAEQIVVQFYDVKIAQDAKKQFIKTFSKKENPDEIKTYNLSGDQSKNIVEVLVASKLVSSKREARRLIAQKAVSIAGEVVSDESHDVERGVLKVGKRRFLRIDF